MSRHSTCIIEGCEATTIRARGLCPKHYERARRHGTLDDVGLPTQRKHQTLGQRFFQYVDAGSHPKGCWIWKGTRNRQGYGQFRITQTKLKLAHRVAWELEDNGSIPEGMLVLHNCFNGAGGCVNPAHLRLGTHKDNKGDWDCTGDRHYRATVPDAVVAETVRRYKAGGVTLAQLADELTERGWPTTKSPIWGWVIGRGRTASLTPQGSRTL